MSKNSDNVNDNVARRRFITVAGSLLGVTGASSMLLSDSAQAVETFPAKLHESLAAYATRVSKDKKDMAAFRKELQQFINGLKKGDDVEKLCQSTVHGRPELRTMFMSYKDENGGRPGIIVFLLLVIIVILIDIDLKQ